MQTPDPADLAARIRAVRLARGLTQGQLALAVGVTRSAVAQWETGRAGQLGSNLARVAEILGTTAGYLLGGALGEGAAPMPMQGNEMALLRAYRDCSPEDQALLLHTAIRLARLAFGQAKAAQRKINHDSLK